MRQLLVKLFRPLYGQSSYPAQPKANNGKLDILLSVWNAVWYGFKACDVPWSDWWIRRWVAAIRHTLTCLPRVSEMETTRERLRAYLGPPAMHPLI